MVRNTDHIKYNYIKDITMHIFLAPFVIGGLVLKIYNNSKKDILNREDSIHLQYDNIKYLNINEMENNLYVRQSTEKKTVNF